MSVRAQSGRWQLGKSEGRREDIRGGRDGPVGRRTRTWPCAADLQPFDGETL